MALNERADTRGDDVQGAGGRPGPRHGRAALLRLASWFEEADPDRADALATAAYGLHPALHLEGQTDEGVAATTSWWQAAPDRSTVTEHPGSRLPEPVRDHRAQQARLRDAAESSAHWRRAGASQIRALLAEPTPLRARLDLSGAGMEVLMELLTAALGSGDASRRPTSAGDLEFSLRLHVGAAPGAEVTIRGEGGELTLEGLRLRVTSYDQHTVEDDGFPGLLAPAGWAPPAARTGSGPLSGDPVTAPAPEPHPLDPDPLDPSTPYTPVPEQDAPGTAASDDSAPHPLGPDPLYPAAAYAPAPPPPDRDPADAPTQDPHLPAQDPASTVPDPTEADPLDPSTPYTPAPYTPAPAAPDAPHTLGPDPLDPPSRYSPAADPLDPSTPYTPAPEPPGRTTPRYDAPPVRGLLATPSAGPGDGGTRTAPAGPDGGRRPAQEPTGPGTDDGAPLPADAPVTGDPRPGPGTVGNPSAPSAEAPGTAGGLPGPDPDVETTGPIDLSADRTRPWG
ncbi:DUF2397 family protein [Streptomonospora nanhaiensis]|uniref:DUF2397 family protein n=1 Tax=Streptomonospora nanhaiensis TaxID=1323731 RepID=A0ABY6YLE8_9ACTN|nr:DUF2397 family protein [Streptomonospora nanhaiensis]WAE72922.1 DUF2397 family protein [Streptomonospora nanhaiensis]